jgi:hypothetical protein
MNLYFDVTAVVCSVNYIIEFKFMIAVLGSIVFLLLCVMAVTQILKSVFF